MQTYVFGPLGMRSTTFDFSRAAWTLPSVFSRKLLEVLVELLEPEEEDTAFVRA